MIFFSEEIQEGAFYLCNLLKDVSFSDNLNVMGDFAFSDCNALKKVDLSKTVIKKIGRLTFENCFDLEQVILPKTLETVEESAFSECDALKTVMLGKAIKDIEKAFPECDEFQVEIQVMEN